MDNTISKLSVIDTIHKTIYGFFDDSEEPMSEKDKLLLKVNKAICNKIKKLPSAQKKGHWIDEGTNYLCSECHRGCWVNSDYCPWCGADMKGKEEG